MKRATQQILTPGARHPTALAWLLLFAFALSGCSPTYVLRAGYEEAKILWRREPIERVLQRPDLDVDTRAKLEMVLDAREFAQQTLHLRAGGSFATYARVDADQVVYVVSAAQRLRLEPYTWWFPIVGRVPYKGFFSKSAAEEEAAALEHAGYDTDVGPSVAFSTLGWFADPLLSNLLRQDRAILASIIIHEILHNTTYLAGRADFDESFATFVGDRGAIAYFTTRSDSAAAARATAVWEDGLRFSDFLGGFVARLRQAYAGGITLAERQRLFEAGQEEFRHLPMTTWMYSDFATRTLNNAIILHHLMYAERLRMFEALFQQQRGDLGRTIAIVLDAIHKEKGDPFAAVQATLGESGTKRGGDGWERACERALERARERATRASWSLPVARQRTKTCCRSPITW